METEKKQKRVYKKKVKVVKEENQEVNFNEEKFNNEDKNNIYSKVYDLEYKELKEKILQLLNMK